MKEKTRNNWRPLELRKGRRHIACVLVAWRKDLDCAPYGVIAEVLTDGRFKLHDEVTFVDPRGREWRGVVEPLWAFEGVRKFRVLALPA